MANRKALTLLNAISRNASVIKGLIDNTSYHPCIPFFIASGILNLTNQGKTPLGARPQDYTSFIRALDGDQVVVEWEDSTKYSIKDDNSAYLPADYKVGKWFKGNAYLDSASTQFSTINVNNGGYNTESIVRTLSIRFTEPLTNDRMLQLWLIPSLISEKQIAIYNNSTEWIKVLKTAQWLRIVNYENNYDPKTGKFIYCDVDFASLNDEFSASGKNIQSFIQLNGGIGGAAAFPQIKVVSEPNKKLKYEVELNQALLRPIGVRYLQIEALGNAGVASIHAMGRVGDNSKTLDKIFAPRHLLPFKMMAPMKSPLSNIPLSSNKYVFYAEALPTLLSGYEDYKDKVDGDFNIWNDKKKQGSIISYNKNIDYVLNTNPMAPIEGLKDNILYWEPKWNINQGDNIHKGIYATNNGYSQYHWEDKNKDEHEVIHSITSNLEIVSQNNNNELNMATIFAHSVFMLNSIQIMPVSIKETTFVRVPLPTSMLNYIPIFGGFLNQFFSGVSVGFNINTSSEKWPKYEGMHFFLNQESFTDLSALYNKVLASQNAYPFDVFTSSTNSDVANTMLASGMFSTTLMFEITDKIRLQPTNIKDPAGDLLPAKTVSTMMLGQRQVFPKIVNNKIDFSDVGDEVYLYNETMKPLSSNTELTDNDEFLQWNVDPKGQNQVYIIDMINIKAIYKGEYIITAYYDNPYLNNGEDTMIYQSIVQSDSKWSDNIRVLETNRKLSYLEAHDGQFPETTFPKGITKPSPFNVEDIRVPIKNYDFTLNNNNFTNNPAYVSGNYSNPNGTIIGYLNGIYWSGDELVIKAGKYPSAGNVYGSQEMIISNDTGLISSAVYNYGFSLDSLKNKDGINFDLNNITYEIKVPFNSKDASIRDWNTFKIAYQNMMFNVKNMYQNLTGFTVEYESNTNTNLLSKIIKPEKKPYSSDYKKNIKIPLSTITASKTYVSDGTDVFNDIWIEATDTISKSEVYFHYRLGIRLAVKFYVYHTDKEVIFGYETKPYSTSWKTGDRLIDNKNGSPPIIYAAINNWQNGIKWLGYRDWQQQVLNKSLINYINFGFEFGDLVITNRN